MLLNILRGYTVQEALDAPRFCISAGSPDTQTRETGTAGDINSEVYFEEGISPETISKLRGILLWWYVILRGADFCLFVEMGHDARLQSGFGRSMMGRGQIIQKLTNETGQLVWAAGCDPRSDGHAAAQI